MEKFYTVENIAEMAMFTTRTIRNYLKEGTLTGRKIGGQWRFTEDDVKKFLEKGLVSDALAENKKQEVLDFMDGVFTEYTGEIQICSVIDIYRPHDKVEPIKDKLMALIGSVERSFARFSYQYDEKDEKARFILFGSPDYIAGAMDVIKTSDNK